MLLAVSVSRVGGLYGRIVRSADSRERANHLQWRSETVSVFIAANSSVLLESAETKHLCTPVK